jgi:hypothetical protein
MGDEIVACYDDNSKASGNRVFNDNLQVSDKKILRTSIVDIPQYQRYPRVLGNSCRCAIFRAIEFALRHRAKLRKGPAARPTPAECEETKGVRSPYKFAPVWG